ncbi:MAG TPA: N(4)-(beta-N-acetylglucosaminyl)-L-asparaginase [Candidatus Baltobacteraceae bacterium]|nr:N(4)-(beta-N-acetylglucosaminyl)-L-asparaginase [Candidatus Baltobacteraceae bacterium]
MVASHEREMDAIDRRTFLASAAGAAALGVVDPAPAAAVSGGPVFISTWDFSKRAIERGAQILQSGGSLLDAIEKGINVIEDDPSITSVGYGGLPNAEGEVELDAGIMDGTRHRAGAVFNLHKIKNPISVARQVLEKTTHTQIAGDGALRFAIEMGFQPMQLLTPESLQAWLKWKSTPNHPTYWIDKDHHDTIGVCAIDGKGKVAAGCSTSGLAWKIPGRVADSPIVGAGYYADDRAGAASATGNGDVMSNYLTSAYIVTKMGEGQHPQEACESVMRYLAKSAPNIHTDMYCVIAIDPRGETGAASINAKQPLTYAVWRDGAATLHTAKAVF